MGGTGPHFQGRVKNVIVRLCCVHLSLSAAHWFGNVIGQAAQTPVQSHISGEFLFSLSIAAILAGLQWPCSRLTLFACLTAKTLKLQRPTVLFGRKRLKMEQVKNYSEMQREKSKEKPFFSTKPFKMHDYSSTGGCHIMLCMQHLS